VNAIKRATVLALLLGVLSACQPVASLSAQSVHSPAPEPRRVLDPTAPAIIAGRPLLAGAPAPDFRLISAAGVTTHLADELQADRPVMLIFYTSHYCRVCEDVLRTLETRRPTWQANGARLIAIARQSVPDAALSAQQAGASYAFLADSDGRVARAYGVWPLLPGKPKNRQSPVIIFIIEPGGLIHWSGSVFVDGQPAVETILGYLFN